MLGGIEIIVFGASISPIKIPKIVVITIPNKIPPLVFLTSRKAITTNPITEIATGFVNAPSPTSVAGLSTISPIDCIPKNAINKPIPAPVASLNSIGIARIRAFLTPVTVKITNIIPDKNTTPRACSQVAPIPFTNVKAKKALSPIPGAIANGAFTQRPVSPVPIIAERQVAVINAP